MTNFIGRLTMCIMPVGLHNRPIGLNHYNIIVSGPT